MSVKGRLVVNHHTNELVGVVHGVFDADVIRSELAESEILDKDEHENESEGNAKKRAS